MGEGGAVIAIDPNQRMVDLLHRSVAANRWMNRIKVKHGAVLDRTGAIDLGQPDGFMGSTSILIRQENRTDTITTIRAQADVLESFLDGNLHVDVLKIDVEGAEPLVWRGAKSVLDANPDIKILIEFSPPMLRDTIGAGAFLDAIRAEGFSLFEIQKNGKLVQQTDETLLSRDLTELYLTRCKVSAT